jgi:hypothetical protein
MFTALTASALTGSLSHIRAALTMPLYWPLQSVAAYRALFELAFRPHYWAKTAHGASGREAPLALLSTVATHSDEAGAAMRLRA